ncbi:MAG: Methylglyoxal reductase, dihydroxyacetone producing @ 2,5-didehydrogluconate reductase (2-dehydro-D-gluconate-forming) (EC [uncultured Paraburkholderia sp.]|nr:MAG: Methylglyoxal reductase, dihydroxyacetone producing @ 2,5-didehydrogluconate reductase (2-dehydro-D-gluconate-forming) (EC [uncultured Paraburkholderia sp.]CAH2925543.1 MAG: Methylglyoxal reductase, dihydroxyacetone producing @ 2,5-didehydrogluconate reductase (2-dehydro-D-gluconate-forming) (EC [uncultured Paraburkholderia sp.]
MNPSSEPQLKLNDGNSIPQVGLGVWQAKPDETVIAVREALQAGYRHVDTAAIYGNEEGVGQGLRESGVPREEVFVTTKIWNDAQGKDSTRKALHESLQRLKLSSVDLLLIHWPTPQRDRFVDTWKTMIALRDKGLVRSIGVSNFTAAHLQRLVNETGVTPVINQIETHPYMQQLEMRKVHERLGILTEAWSPLAQNRALDDATIERIAKKHGKTPAQVIIRWHLDSNHVVIPKSVTPARIRSNFDVFDFRLDADDMKAIAALNRDERLGPDPETFNG